VPSAAGVPCLLSAVRRGFPVPCLLTHWEWIWNLSAVCFLSVPGLPQSEAPPAVACSSCPLKELTETREGTHPCLLPERDPSVRRRPCLLSLLPCSSLFLNSRCGGDPPLSTGAAWLPLPCFPASPAPLGPAPTCPFKSVLAGVTRLGGVEFSGVARHSSAPALEAGMGKRLAPGQGEGGVAAGTAGRSFGRRRGGGARGGEEAAAEGERGGAGGGR